MSDNLGTTKINDIVQTSELTENDTVVETILKELEGDNDDDNDELNLNNNDIYYQGTDDDNENDFNNNEFNNVINNNENTTENKMFEDNNMIKEDNSVLGDIMPDFIKSPSSDVSIMFTIDEFGNSCLNTIKYGIIVFLIVILINNNLVIKHLSSIKIFIEDDKLNTYAYLLQAGLCGVIFIIIYHLMNNL